MHAISPKRANALGYDPRVDSTTIFKLVLPAALAVTTFALGSACRDEQEYCVDIESKSKCESAAGCAWDSDTGLCQNICSEIEDEMECKAIERCEWSASGESGESDTGGAGCHEPFT